MFSYIQTYPYWTVEATRSNNLYLASMQIGSQNYSLKYQFSLVHLWIWVPTTECPVQSCTGPEFNYT